MKPQPGLIKRVKCIFRHLSPNMHQFNLLKHKWRFEVEVGSAFDRDISGNLIHTHSSLEWLYENAKGNWNWIESPGRHTDTDIEESIYIAVQFKTDAVLFKLSNLNVKNYPIA